MSSVVDPVDDVINRLSALAQSGNPGQIDATDLARELIRLQRIKLGRESHDRPVWDPVGRVQIVERDTMFNVRRLNRLTVTVKKNCLLIINAGDFPFGLCFMLEENSTVIVCPELYHVPSDDSKPSTSSDLEILTMGKGARIFALAGHAIPVAVCLGGALNITGNQALYLIESPEEPDSPAERS